jgi:hypothetical protein
MVTELPKVDEYTPYKRLSGIRKIIFGDVPEFVSFDSEKGQNLLYSYLSILKDQSECTKSKDKAIAINTEMEWVLSKLGVSQDKIILIEKKCNAGPTILFVLDQNAQKIRFILKAGDIYKMIDKAMNEGNMSVYRVTDDISQFLADVCSKKTEEMCKRMRIDPDVLEPDFIIIENRR